MNKQTLLAIGVGFVVSFLLGWLVYGMMLMDYMGAHTLAGFNKTEEEMSFGGLIVGTLAMVVLFTLLLSKMGATDLKKGAIAGLWIGFLVTLSYDSYFWAATHLYSDMEVICVDVIASSLMNAIMGGVIGWMLGMKGKTATA
jgi:Protein of unknown function (DUF1761)